MRLIIAFVAVVLLDTANCSIFSDLGNLLSHDGDCRVKFKDPLTQYSKFFNRFLWTSSCMKLDYLGKNETPKPFKGHLPDIPAVDIESVANITEKFPFIVGPETIAVVENEDVAYTGASDGYIYKIDLVSWNATRLTSACRIEGVSSCRPLGIRVTSDRKIYFADSAGLCVHDLDTDEVKVLVPLRTEVDGAKLTLPNDLDVDEEAGIVYMSDGSTMFPNSRVLRGTLLHETSGRVLAYDIATAEVSVLVANLSFPNGVQLNRDQKTLLVNEMNTRRILQVRLDGDQRGQYSVFTPELPGEPDNIRAASDGNFWVAINLARNGKEMALFDYLADDGCATRSFIRMNDMVAEYLQLVASATQEKKYAQIAEELSSYHFISEMASHQGTFVLVSGDGRILKKYTTDKVGYFSNPIQYKNLLLVGNDRHANIAVIEGLL